VSDLPPKPAVSGYAHGEDTYVVEVIGELDLHLEPQLRDELSRMLAGSYTRLVVDLTEVHFVDSSALGRLVEAAKVLGGRSGGVVLAAPDRQIRRLLEITALDRLFAVSLSLDDALSGPDLVAS